MRGVRARDGRGSPHDTMRDARSVRSSVGLITLLVTITGCCAFAAAQPSPGPSVPQPTTPRQTHVTVAYAAISASQAAAWVAKEEGIFAKNGLDVDLESIPGGSSPTAALIADKIQALQISMEAIEATLAGADIVYVAAPLSIPLFSLVCVPSITEASQLKGAKVAMTGFGTATYYADIVALQHLGLDPFKDVTLIRAGSLPAMVTALQSGQIQAAALSMPTLAQAKQLGMRVLVNVASLGVRYPSSWLAVTRRTIRTHPGLVDALVRSITEAIAFEKRQPQRTMEIIGRYAKINDSRLLSETYRATVPHLNRAPLPSADDVREALKLIAIRNPEAAKADPATFVDTRFVERLQKSGFIDRLYTSTR